MGCLIIELLRELPCHTDVLKHHYCAQRDAASRTNGRGAMLYGKTFAVAVQQLAVFTEVHGPMLGEYLPRRIADGLVA